MTKVNRSQQKSAFFNGSRSSAHEMQADYRRARQVLLDRYWNIKGLGHFVVFFCLNYLRFMRFGRYHFEQVVVPLRYRS